jgi:hypothetical protein
LVTSATGLGILFAIVSQSVSKGKGESINFKVLRFMMLRKTMKEKLTITEVKEDDFGQKTKKAQNAFQELFTTAIDTGKSIASEKAKKLAAMNFYSTADII